MLARFELPADALGVAMGTRQGKNTALGRLQNKYGGLKQFLANSEGVSLGDDRGASYTDDSSVGGEDTDNEEEGEASTRAPSILLIEGKVSNKEFYLTLN